MPISDTVCLGKNINIPHPSLVNLYGCTIGDETKIGAFVEIQKNASIGARCKISSHTFICEGVSIEDEVFVGHGVMFTNDRSRARPTQTAACRPKRTGRWRPTSVKRGASIGSNVTIVAGVTIGEGRSGRRGRGRHERRSGLRDRRGRAGAVIGDTRSDSVYRCAGSARPEGICRFNRAQLPFAGSEGHLDMINIGIVGYGYWGPNLVRNFAETPGASVAAVADLDTGEARARQAPLSGREDDHPLPGSARRPGHRRRSRSPRPSAPTSSSAWRPSRPASICGSRSRWRRPRFRPAS